MEDVNMEGLSIDEDDDMAPVVVVLHVSGARARIGLTASPEPPVDLQLTAEDQWCEEAWLRSALAHLQVVPERVVLFLVHPRTTI